MKFCKLGLLESERDVRPGSIGDSCANTCRWIGLENYVYAVPRHDPNLYSFITNTGYVRHPDSPWREDDFPSDQFLPLYLVAGEKYKMKLKGWTTDGKNLASPVLLAVMKKKRWLVKFCLWGQAQLFKLPFRWNDEKKWFEKTAISSCDYLNWFQVAITIPESKGYISSAVLRSKIRSYYLDAFPPEPKISWILELYDQALEKFYGFPTGGFG